MMSFPLFRKSIGHWILFFEERHTHRYLCILGCYNTPKFDNNQLKIYDLNLDTQGLYVLYSSTMKKAYDNLNNENLYRHPFGVNSKLALRAKILCFETGKR